MTKKKYKIKKTKSLIKKLNPFWEKLQELEGNFHQKVWDLEKEMMKTTGIKDIEFFWSDLGEYAGIGNLERTMGLIHREELEK